MQTEISKLANKLVLHFQQGGETIQKLAECQKNLLAVEIERQIGCKVKELENGVNQVLKRQVEEISKMQQDLFHKVSVAERSTEELKKFVVGSEEKRKLQEKSLTEVREVLRELSSGLEGRFQKFSQECQKLGG
jgi:hypothetical protein